MNKLQLSTGRAAAVFAVLLAVGFAPGVQAQETPAAAPPLNLDLSVPGGAGFAASGPAGTTLAPDDSFAGPAGQKRFSKDGLFLGNTGAGSGKLFFYGQNVQRTHEGTGLKEKANRKFGIKLSTDLDK